MNWVNMVFVEGCPTHTHVCLCLLKGACRDMPRLRASLLLSCVPLSLHRCALDFPTQLKQVRHGHDQAPRNAKRLERFASHLRAYPRWSTHLTILLLDVSVERSTLWYIDCLHRDVMQAEDLGPLEANNEALKTERTSSHASLGC